MKIRRRRIQRKKVARKKVATTMRIVLGTMKIAQRRKILAPTRKTMTTMATRIMRMIAKKKNRPTLILRCLEREDKSIIEGQILQGRRTHQAWIIVFTPKN